MPRKMKKHGQAPSEEPPTKRAKFFSDDEGEGSDSDNDAAKLSINPEFAKRFEYNKKREERQRLEEKYGSNAQGDDDDDSSTSEEEDDAADLATQELDAEIFATLNAIKKKDPRVYDKDVTFYTPFDPEQLDQGPKKEKPMYLTDYHRQNLLSGNTNPGQDDDEPPQTYAQEQQALKDDLINQMHTATAEEDQGDNDDEFFTKKPRALPEQPQQPNRPKISERDIVTADKDPENFLSNFMAARAWVPSEASGFQAFDSDDSEDERRAEQFEEAYNLRFEDPKTANEKLMTYGRDIAKLSVRREEKSGRKKQREKEREKKEDEKRERHEEKARLRKLKIDEVEEKVKKIKEAAGLKNQQLDLNDWKQVLDEDWDDEHWEQEMKRRFGDNYYAEQDIGIASDADEDDEEEEETGTKKSKKVKKPSWDDDIDIKDLIPDFEDEEKPNPDLKLSDIENDDNQDDDNVEAEENEEEAEAPDGTTTKRKTKKDRLKERADAKRVARKERMAIEELVDADLTSSLPPNRSSSSSSNKQQQGFRYRETSPTTFGLTAKDILFADDTALNTFAGLKKMAAWRDEDKKKRDRKKLGKKARLRQWRKETFGNEDGFSGGFREFLGEGKGDQSAAAAAAEGGSKKRRGKKRKAEEVVES